MIVAPKIDLSGRMKEQDYYPKVAAWTDKKLGCFHTAVNAGLRLGRINVVGLVDKGGYLAGRSKVISIEVKHGKQPFAASIGQASGYSIYAHTPLLPGGGPQTLLR